MPGVVHTFHVEPSKGRAGWRPRKDSMIAGQSANPFASQATTSPRGLPPPNWAVRSVEQASGPFFGQVR